MRHRIRRPTARALVFTVVIASALVCSVIGSAVSSPRAGRADGEKSLDPAGEFAATASLAGMPFAPPKADLDQVRNGSFDAPIDPPNWVNGNAGASNAHYFEGQSIPYRIRLTNISTGAGNPHTLDIEWDLKHSGVNAIDYITHYDRIAENVLPCLGVAGCNPASFSTFPIPAPSSAGTPVGNQPVTSFNALPAAQKVMTIYNGTITGLSYQSQGNLNAAQSSTSLRISFTASSPTVVIAWGGHIASAGDWGQGNSAGGISGSPYHTRLLAFDGSGGNQDRSLSAAAVRAPQGCDLDGPATVCESDDTAEYTITNPEDGVSYQWAISASNQTTPAQISGTPTGPSATVDNVGSPGQYTIRATPMNAGGSGAFCEFTTVVQANTATSDLTDGADVCPGTNVEYSTTATGGDGNCSFTWSLNGNAFTDIDGTPGGSHVTIDTSGLGAGTHTVEVSVDCNCGPPAVQSTTFNVKAVTSIADPIDATSACDDFAGPKVFTVAASGTGPFTYAWTVDGNPATDADGDDTKLTLDGSSTPKLVDLAAGSHTVNVRVTGACGFADSSAALTINGKPTVTITIGQACDALATLTAHPSPGLPGDYTYSWTGPGIQGATNGQSVTVNATGVYTVTVTDGNSCNGSVDGQLCFTLTSPAPPLASIQVVPGTPNAPAEVKQESQGLIAKVAKLFSWLI